ncbi:MAG: Vgb family protein [Candidatus Dormibacteria bacterium]
MRIVEHTGGPLGRPAAGIKATGGAVRARRGSRRTGRRTYLVAALGVLELLALVLAASPASASGLGTITEYRTGLTSNANPFGITAGPDGNLWFTELNADNIGKITPAGTITEYPVGSVSPLGITAGPDGNLWFTEYTANKIGKITTAGAVTAYSVPTVSSDPHGITAGPDGNLWFTEYTGNKIGKITPAGTITEYTVATATSDPLVITAGPDGNLWFTEKTGNKIGRITPTGTITEYTVPTASSDPYGITAGPDGNLWFTENAGNKIGRITPTGTITEYTVPTASSNPVEITAGPDGNLWFTENAGNNIGKISTAGTITEYPVPTVVSGPQAIAAGPDGNVWFTELTNASGSLGGAIGQLQTPSAGVQATSATVTPGVLSVALANPTVPFGSLTPGITSAAVQVGNITYTDTLGDHNGWTATVAATDLVDLAAGTNPPTAIGAANLTYTPGGISATLPSSASSGSAASFGFATACRDLSPGVSFSCPLTLATAPNGTGTTAQGTFTQTGGTVVLAVPGGQAPGSYSGLLQYTLTN